MLEIDRLGVPYGWQKGNGDWEGVKNAIARHAPVQIIQEAGSTEWRSRLPPNHAFYFGFPEYTATTREQPPAPNARVWISPIQRQFSPDSMPKVQWHPRVLWVGIGCERGVSQALIEQAIREIFRSHHLAERAIAGMATINTKSNESGLVDFCGDRAFPLRYFSAETLDTVSIPTPSNVVDTFVRTSSVSEAAAILGSEKAQSSFTQSLLIPKKIFRAEGQSGAVTIAVAQSEREWGALPLN